MPGRSSRFTRAGIWCAGCTKNGNGGALNSTTGHSIASHFAQGREYFRSAANAAILVRPLLLHYGVVALSRGLILMLNRGLKPEALADKHGLTCHQWKTRLASSGIADVGNLEVQLTLGTFTTLLAATGNRERCLVNSGSSKQLSMEDRGWTRELPAPLVGAVLPLHDVLARIPDLDAIFERVTAANECVETAVWVGIRGEVVMPDDATTLLELRIQDGEGIDVNDLRRRLGPASTAELEREQGSWHLQMAFRDDADLDANAPAIKDARNGAAFLVSPFTTGTHLSSLLSLYAVSFAIGMVVRYHPAAWADLMGRATGDRMFPILRAADELVEEHFPELVVKELETPI